MAPGFQSGIQHLQEAIEAGKRRAESSGGSPGSSLNYFNWAPGDKKIIRFPADDMITGQFYDFIVDKGGKTKNFMVDPDDPDRLSRYRSATPGIGWKKPFNSDTLEEPKATTRAVQVAVLRQEVTDPVTGQLKREDYIYDREVDGKIYPSRWFGIVQQGVNNFWHTLAVSCFKRFGSLATMDYEITREGKSLDTKYSIIPLPEDPNLNNTDIVKKFYFYGEKWDPNDEQRFLKCPQTTHEWAAYFSGEERHQHWLVPDLGTTSSPAGGQGFAGAADEAQSGPPAPASGTQFETLADTLLKKARGE
jgi:hypothetical protein